MKARHTKIEEALVTKEGLLVREAYYGRPKGISNIYLQDKNEKVRWEAELPMPDDVFANPIVLDGEAFRCATWNGITCTLSLATGKSIASLFTK